ncbi:hypothetical protein ABWL24_21290, partial [Priestia megaterium]
VLYGIEIIYLYQVRTDLLRDALRNPYIVVFGTLAHGLLGGTWSKDKVDHSNAHIPLFSKENIGSAI